MIKKKKKKRVVSPAYIRTNICVCLSGGRIIRVSGQHLDVVQEPCIRVTLTPLEPHSQRRRRRSSVDYSLLRRARRIVPEPNCPEDSLCVVKQVEFTQVSLCLCFLTALNILSNSHMSVIVKHFVSSCPVPDQVEEQCTVNSSTLILCPTPEVGPEALRAAVSVHFLLDNLHFEFEAVSGSPFSYEPNPVLHSLNQHDPSKPLRHKPGSIISVEVSPLSTVY